MRFFFLFLLVVSALIYCIKPETHSTTITGKSLDVKAIYETKVKPFRDTESKIEGKITVSNKSSEIQRFGNEFLSFRTNGVSADRTYKDTIASELIDLGTVEIQPYTSLSLQVYWVLDHNVSKKIDSAKLFLDEQGLERVKHRTLPSLPTFKR